eukprot:5450954-Lingulodinium_polyedra.AAC.1
MRGPGSNPPSPASDSVLAVNAAVVFARPAQRVGDLAAARRLRRFSGVGPSVFAAAEGCVVF